MKEQFAILPPLPIVGSLKIFSKDGKSLNRIEVTDFRPTELTPFFKKCHKEFANFLTGKTQTIDIELDYSELTPFQLKVLKEMKKISFGKVATYKDLANGMKSKGYQAIGTACGRNPFMLIYPCHRVLGTNNLGGFAHGLEMKKSLLALEGVK